MARLAGKYAIAKDISPDYVFTKTGYFPFSIQRLGLDSPATYSVTIIPIGSEITNIGSSSTFTAASTTECHIRIDDPAGNGGITWSGYNFEVSLARSSSHKEHAFFVCSYLCCTSDASGEEVCACRHPDADSCQPELQPAFVPT